MSSHHLPLDRRLGDIHVGNHDSPGACARCLMVHTDPDTEHLCKRARARLGSPSELSAFRDLLNAIRAERIADVPTA